MENKSVHASELEKQIDKLEKLGDKITDAQKEELDYLKSKNRVDNLKQDVTKDGSFLHGLYASDSPKKDAIEKWAEELELQFNYETKHKLQTTVKSIGSISSFIKVEMKKLGAHESVYSYVHKVLMFKYKADDRNSKNEEEQLIENDSRNNSSLNTDYTKENSSLIDICEKQKLVLDKEISIYKNYPILSSMTPEERMRISGLQLNILATQSILLQSYDNRQKIPLYYQAFLFHAFMVHTNNEAASMYWTNVKLHAKKEEAKADTIFRKSAKFAMRYLSENDRRLFIDTMNNIEILRGKIGKIIEEKSEKQFELKDDDGLTSKQAMKFANGFVPELIDIMNPKNRNEALLKNFYGIQCPVCGDWKVERRPNDAHEMLCLCHNCETWFEAKTYPMCIGCKLPFFDEYLPLMKQIATEDDDYHTATKCPRCSREVTFDKKLMAKIVIRSQK